MANYRRLFLTFFTAGSVAAFAYLVVLNAAENYFFPAECERTELAVIKIKSDSDHSLVLNTESPTFSHADDWPNLFGPHHDNSSHESVFTSWGTTPPPQLWETKIGEGYSSPIVDGEQLIVSHRIADEEIITCLNSKTGSILWERRFPTAFVCRAVYTNGPYSTPVTDGQFVYAISAEGTLRCLKLADGELVWKRDFHTHFGYEQRAYGAGCGPLIWKEMIIVNAGGKTGDTGIIAFDKATGAVRWSATDHDCGYSTPRIARIHDKDYLFVLTYDGFVSLDPESGTVHWEFPFKSPISNGENAVTPLIVNDLVFVNSYGNGSICLKILTDGSYEKRWEGRRSLTSQFTPVIAYKDHVYGVHCADHSLRCIELSTGKIKWRARTDLRRATSIRVGAELILLGEFGHLATLHLNDQQCELTSMTDESLFNDTFCFASPALSQGRLYLRNEQKLICLDITKK